MKKTAWDKLSKKEREKMKKDAKALVRNSVEVGFDSFFNGKDYQPLQEGYKPDRR